MSSLPQHWYRLRNKVRARGSGFWITILLAFWLAAIIDGYKEARHPQARQQENGTFDGAAQDSALRLWDRIYRLNAAAEHHPVWVRWLMRHEPPVDLLEQASNDFHALWSEQALDDRGLTTWAVMEQYLIEQKPELAEDESVDDADAVGEATPAARIEPIVDRALGQDRWRPRVWQMWEQRFQRDEVFWWEVEYVEKRAKAQNITLLDEEIAVQRERNDRLFRRNFLAGIAHAGLYLAGLCCLPWGIRRMAAGWRSHQTGRVVRYAHRLSLSLILLLLLITELGNNTLFALLGWLLKSWEESWWKVMVHDVLWRALPMLVLLWYLFRKPSWVVRSYGLDRAPQWSIILSLFVMLMASNFVLIAVMGGMESDGSAYELDPMEHGWPGLAYGLISACIMAPLAEEFIYRGFLFRGLLRKSGFWLAGLLSSLVFAVSHYYDLFGTISVGLCGMATAYAYLTTRSLLNAILLHALYNLSITIPGWLLFHLDL